MTAQEIRTAYLNYFKAREHALIERASLVPKDDPTTLFTGSGMQALIPYLLGKEHPDGVRLVGSQICLRAQDIDEVGDNRHTTFFEMLGNWSLGDYFKRQQISWFVDFLVEEVGLDADKIYATCFIGSEEHGIDRDDESAGVWQELFEKHGIKAETAEIGSQTDGDTRGIKPGERIFFYDDGENWWSRGGGLDDTPVGDPCGPDSEVFYEFSDVEHRANLQDAHGNVITGEHCHPACECGRFMEIGNQVFMQYRKTDDGFELLDQPNVDFGGGLERIAAAAIDAPDVFKISLFQPIIEKLEQLSGHGYDDKTEDMRVIADHLRAAMFLAVDGVKPSNKREGYVMRRLMRRAILKAFDLGIENQFVEEVASVVAEAYRQDFPELEQNEDDIIGVLLREEKAFKQTLRKGLKEFNKLSDDGLTGQEVFMLYDTYGFPVELSVEQAQKQDIVTSEDWRQQFDTLMEQQRQQSRSASKGQFKGGLGGDDLIHKKYHTATHLMYQALRDVLGDHVIQRGSNITEERLRFDFSHPQKVTPEQIAEIEKIVNEQIANDLPMTWQEMNTKEALSAGVLGAFGDKYGETVKVYTAGDPNGEWFSQEICGGPHVDHTAQLSESNKTFKITKEEASSAGIRRIKAVLR